MHGLDRQSESQALASHILAAMIRLERAKCVSSSLLSQLAARPEDDAQADLLLEKLARASGYESRFRGRRNREMRRLMLQMRDEG